MMGTRVTAGGFSAPAQLGAPVDAGLPEMNLLPLPPNPGSLAAPEERIPVSTLQVEGVGVDEAQVKCSFKGAEPVKSYRLEVQTLAQDAHGMPEAKWVRFARATVKADGLDVTAEMEHLQPNALYVVRLVGMDEKGRVAALSSAAQVRTAKPIASGRWGLIGAGLAALAAAGIWWRRKRARGN